MNYTINYHIDSIKYIEKKRVTEVVIVNEDTGEVFKGRAHRYPADEMDIALATNLATARAVRKAILTDLKDCEKHISENGAEFQFNY